MAWRSGLPILLCAAVLGCGPRIGAPEFRLLSVSAKSAQETVVSLAIYNPNRFPLHVLSVGYDVSVAGKLCGRGLRAEPLFLDARDTTNADFNLSLDWGGIAGAIPSLLKDSVVVGVKGSYYAEHEMFDNS